jgi:hypothetical protein
VVLLVDIGRQNSEKQKAESKEKAETSEAIADCGGRHTFEREGGLQ